MNQDITALDIIFLALVAGFLILRLRSVLGQRTENDVQVSAPSSTVVPLRKATDVPPADLSSAGKILWQADHTFDEQTFLGGARAAFEMILEAYTAGNTDVLRSLLDEHVYAGFVRSIEDRQSRGEKLHNELVKIHSIDLISARMEGETAYATVRFVSDQYSAILNEEKTVLSGSLESVERMTDDWTFARNILSNSPDWVLVMTVSPEV